MYASAFNSESGSAPSGGFVVSLIEESGALGTALENLKQGQYQVGRDTLFDRQGPKSGSSYYEHGFLYRALAYADSTVCEVKDVMKSLKSYEDALCARSMKGELVQVNALYFLAHARKVRKASKGDVMPTLAGALLFKFRDVYGSDWLREDELQFLTTGDGNKEDMDWYLENGSEGGSRLRSRSGMGKVIDSVQTQWEKLREQLTEEQQEPMDELLSLTGLDSVKELALNLYRDVLADKKLKENGFEKCVVDRTLNFTFMGNPVSFYFWENRKF